MIANLLINLGTVLTGGAIWVYILLEQRKTKKQVQALREIVRDSFKRVHDPITAE